MNTILTTEERVWSVISHLSSLAFGMGIVLPIVGWADQRRKSNYASFQSLQALGYQSLGFTVWILSVLVVIIIASVIMLIMVGGGNNASTDTVLRPGVIILFTLLFGLFAIYFLLPILAAVACALGRDFRYPFLGDRLARYLGYDPAGQPEGSVWLNEENEVCWVAAMGHFSILIAIWGMLAPLTAWILIGKHNLFLKFQSIQTLTYQALTTVLYFVALFIYLFGFVLLVAGAGGMESPNLDSPMGLFGIVLFGVSLLISFVLLLIVPLLHILGQWAGLRVLQGENYRYPFIGQLVQKWITSKSMLEEKMS